MNVVMYVYGITKKKFKFQNEIVRIHVFMLYFQECRNSHFFLSLLILAYVRVTKLIPNMFENGKFIFSIEYVQSGKHIGQIVEIKSCSSFCLCANVCVVG